MRIAALVFSEVRSSTNFREIPKRRFSPHILSLIASSRTDITAWEYDPLGRQKKYTEGLFTPFAKVTTYTYKPSGELDVITKNNGIELRHEYDKLGRLKEYYETLESIHYVYTYDANGNPTVVDECIEKVSTIKEFDHADASLLKKETLSNGVTVEYRYDRLARVTEILLHDGTSIAYEYLGPYLHKVVRRTATGEKSHEHVYEAYDLNGHLRQACRIGNCGTVEYDYDLQGRLRTLREPRFSETIQQRDAVGNLQRRSFTDGLGTIQCQYVYDDLYQVHEEEGVVHHQYYNDSHYNQEEKDGKVTYINEMHQLCFVGETRYDYDANGNRELIEGPKGVVKYYYDDLDRLAAVESKAVRVIYCYDETNRRMSKESQVRVGDIWEPWKIERALYFGPHEVGTCDVEGKLLQLKVLGHGKNGAIGAAVAVELKGKVYAPMHDHFGHVVGLLSAVDGVVQESYRYSVFGEEFIYDADGEDVEGGAENPWRYVGKRRDDETGLVYFGMRYYDPEVSRWLTPDPIGLKGGPNLYAYVLNNPLVYADPFGLFGTRVDMDRYSGPSISLKQTAERVGEGLKTLARVPGQVVEQIGRHAIPIPGVRDAVAATGVLMQGRSLADFEPSWKSEHSEFLCTAEGSQTDAVYLGVINGIGVTKSEMIIRMHKLQDAYDGKMVYAVYCGTKGAVSDLVEWAAQRLGIRTHQVAVAENYFRYMSNLMGTEGQMIQYNHSRGTETSYRGSLAISRDARRQFSVTNFGGAHITEKGHYGEVENFIGSHDYVSFYGDPIRFTRAKLNPQKHDHIKFLSTNT